MSKKPFVTKEQVEEIVKTYPTPFHLYDEKGIRENVNVSGRGRLDPFVRVERLCCFGPHNRPPWHRRSASQY